MLMRNERLARPTRDQSMTQEHFDVLIVGAGLSGIGAGYHLQKNCPRKINYQA